MPRLALRALRAPGPPINSILEIKTLLSNGLITEAFELQRSKCDEELLIEFYKGCHELKKWNCVLGLALTEREGDVLLKFLQSCGSLLSENLQLLYLLQRNKYIEAVNYLDSLKHKHRPRNLQQRLDNTQDLILSSYKLGMTESEKKLSDIYISIRDRIPKETEEIFDDVKPLSTVLNKQLLGNELNIVDGIFHRAIVNAKAIRSAIGIDVNENYVPFLSKPNIDFDFFENNNYNPVSYPKPYIPSGKRRKEAIDNVKDVVEGNLPAAKRQRTDSFSVADKTLRSTMGANALLLTSFRSKHLDKSKGKLDQSPSTSPKESPIRRSAADDSVNLLSTPVVKSMRLDKRISGRSERAQTPQSILKHRHTDHGSIASRRSLSPALTAGSARRSVDFDDRSIRFNTQNTSIDSGDDDRLSAIPESNIDDESGSDQIKISYSSVQARQGIHAADTSILSTSTDEFYSPETSKLSEQPMVRTLEVMESESEDDQQEAEKVLKLPTRQEQSVSPVVKPRTPLKRTARSRSATPEVFTPSPSRMATRSKSKQQLNETADSFEHKSDERSELETSTPLQSIKGRASLRSFKVLNKPLSKTVIESNAMKAFIERSRASKTALNIEETEQQKQYESMDSSTVSSEASDSSRTQEQKITRNVLEDKSYVSDSLMKQYRNELDSTIYSDNSSFGTTNIRPRRNILHDSSSMEVKELEKDICTANESQPKDETISDIQEKSDVLSNNQEDDAMSEGNDEVTASIQNVVEEEKRGDEKQEVQHVSLESEKTASNSESSETIPIEEEENQTATVVDDVEMVEKPSENLDSSSDEAGRRNILRDDSKVSDTFLKRYNDDINTTVFHESSSVFTRAKNILEDSSFGPLIGTSSKNISIEIEEKVVEKDKFKISTTEQKIQINVQQEKESEQVASGVVDKVR